MPEAPNNKSTRRTERIGKYEILDHLATGGMSVIYKARDMDLDRLVALKILPIELAKQQTTLIRFQREARAAALLRHENIVTIFDVGECNGTYFIALEFIEGTDLQDYITRQCKLDPEEARQIIIQATHALVHAYERGITHRDIKPSNFLLMHKGKRLIVKLTDFGLAIQHENDAEFRITRDKTTVGTVDYMSPEQARDSRSADIRSDIYSLGCTLYHMLTGFAPFARGTLPERIVHHMHTPAPDVRKQNKLVPDYLAAIIARMLAKKPEDRYQTPAELLYELENPDAVVVPGRNGMTERVERDGRRKRKFEPTQIIDEAVEEEAIEEESDRPRPSRVAKTRKPSERRDSDVDVELPADAMDDSSEHDRSTESTDDSSEHDRSTESMDDSAPLWPAPRKKTATSSPMWMYVTGGTVGLLGLVLIIALIFGGKTPRKDPEPEKKPPPVFVEAPDHKILEPPPLIDTSAALMTVGPLPWPVMDTLPEEADLAALRKEYFGPFQSFPQTSKGDLVVPIRRLASANRTLADAFAESKPKQVMIIEINDNGPLFVPSLPALADRTIVVRGGDGFRPMIVWDVPKKSAQEKAVATFCALTQGKLILDNLDFVMRWAEDTPATVFALSGSDFHARNCTFSMAGKTTGGIALVRRYAVKATAPTERPTQTWLKRCYVRGPAVSLLDSQDTPSAVLLEESLIVGYQQPLFQLRGREEDDFSLRCIRSTLVTGQVLLRWQSSTGGAPLLGRMLDSILSRDDTTAPQGDMIQLAGVNDLTKMNWRAENSVYAGWKQLLASGVKNIAGTDLDTWHRQWFYSTGDRAVPDNWPKSPPAELEDQPAQTFLPTRTPEPAPIAFAALTSTGSTGFVHGWLPAAPTQWIERAFNPRDIPNVPAADFDVPAVEVSKDGLYYGERLDLGKPGFDLGAHLTKMLQTYKPAPRVVMHLTGRGVYPTSPMRIKGVQHLVLYFDSGKEPGSGATLEASAASIKLRAPLIDMIGGQLDVIGARFQLSNVTLVPAIVQVQNGGLTLTRCWLQGPLSKSADAFQNLIAVSNPNPTVATVLLRDNVLVSGKLLLYLNENVQLKARNNLFVSLGDAVRIDATAPPTPIKHVFDHNTIAARQTLLMFRTGSDAAGAPTSVQANSNAFLSPFAGEDFEKPTLLRGAETWAARGRWGWQGRHNVYDSRWHAYFAGFDKFAGPKQALADWQLVWGQAGEDNAALFSAPNKTVALEGATPAALRTELEKLALPKQLRGDPNQSPPGADLPALGVLRKKG